MNSGASVASRVCFIVPVDVGRHSLFASNSRVVSLLAS